MLTEKTKNFIEKIAKNMQEKIGTSDPKKYEIGKIVDFVQDMKCEVEFNQELDSFNTKDGKKTICLSFTKNDNNNENLKILFHEIWHFISSSLSDVEVSSQYSEVSINPNEAEANYFSRAMLLPEESFVNEVINNITDSGMCNIFNVATLFNVSYLDVIARGNDLSIWNKKGGI